MLELLPFDAIPWVYPVVGAGTAEHESATTIYTRACRTVTNYCFFSSSGIALFPPCSFVPRLVSPSVLSSRFFCSSAERGPRGLVWASELDVRGKRQTVCQLLPESSICDGEERTCG